MGCRIVGMMGEGRSACHRDGERWARGKENVGVFIATMAWRAGIPLPLVVRLSETVWQAGLQGWRAGRRLDLARTVVELGLLQSVMALIADLLLEHSVFIRWYRFF